MPLWPRDASFGAGRELPSFRAGRELASFGADAAGKGVQRFPVETRSSAKGGKRRHYAS